MNNAIEPTENAETFAEPELQEYPEKWEDFSEAEREKYIFSLHPGFVFEMSHKLADLEEQLQASQEEAAQYKAEIERRDLEAEIDGYMEAYHLKPQAREFITGSTKKERLAQALSLNSLHDKGYPRKSYEEPFSTIGFNSEHIPRERGHVHSH